MNNANRLQTLFELGEIHDDEPWLDYPAHGITAADVPALLALIADKSLHNADYDSNEIWAPNHAWRALGQLGCAECVEPLLELLEEYLVQDIWAAEELPIVMGMIGVDAIAPLAAYLRDSSHSEEARIIVAESLKTVAEEHPASRDQVVEIFSTYLITPDRRQPALNGIVVCCLLDLKANSAMEPIRALYETGAVDISYAGDIEDVEIALGYREARATPQPTHGHAHGSVQRAAQLPESSKNLDEEISGYLARYGSEASINNIYELDGFFAALGCSPDSIQPSEWLIALWGGEGATPAWPNRDEANNFISAVMVTYNRVVQALNSDTYAPLFSERKESGKRIAVADDWCRGFMRGVNLWPTLSAIDALFLKEQLQPIRLFVSDAGAARLKAMTAEAITQQQRAIAASVRHMYQHWLNERVSVNAPVKAEPKIGRNDPCPCGSGKKFKKCCLH
jgi:uncharacterized protein